MGNESQTILFALTREEAVEVFSRCLKSAEEDTDAFASALKKIGHALGTAISQPEPERMAS